MPHFHLALSPSLTPHWLLATMFAAAPNVPATSTHHFQDPDSVPFDLAFSPVASNGERELRVGLGLNFERLHLAPIHRRPRLWWEASFGSAAAKVDVSSGLTLAALGVSSGEVRFFDGLSPDPRFLAKVADGDQIAAIEGAREHPAVFGAGSAGQNLVVYRWSGSSPDWKWRVTLPALGRFDSAQGLSVSDRGDLILLTSYKQLHLLSGSNGAVLGVVAHLGQAIAQLSGDGAAAVAANFDGAVTLFRTGSDGFETSWSVQYDGAWPTVDLARDGGTVAVSEYYPAARDSCWLAVYDAASPTPLWRTPSIDFMSLALSDDGERIAAGTWGDLQDLTVDFSIFDRSGPPARVRHRTEGSVYSVALSGDGEFFAYGTKSVHARVLGRGGRVISGAVDSQRPDSASSPSSSPIPKHPTSAGIMDMQESGPGERTYFPVLPTPLRARSPLRPPTAWRWRPVDGLLNPAGIAARDLAHPALGSLDGDLTRSLVLGYREGGLARYSLRPPGVWERAPLDLRRVPLDGLHTRPVLGDLNGDQREDLLVGHFDGSLILAENRGDGRFVGAELPGIEVGLDASPELADLDDDGDLDLVLGQRDGGLRWFQNTGSPSAPRWEPATVMNLDVGFGVTPDLSDLDGDGDLDLIAGRRGGDLLHAFLNVGAPSRPRFVRFRRPGDVHFWGWWTAPALDPTGTEAWLGVESGPLRTMALPSNPEPSPVGPAPTPFVPLAAFDAGARSVPALATFDASRPATLVVAALDGPLWLVPPVGRGDADSTAFTGITPGFGAALGAGDLNGDGDVELITGDASGEVMAWEGHPRGAWIARPDLVRGVHGTSWASPELGDLDGDERKELLIGQGDGSIVAFDNTGTPEEPRWVARPQPLPGIAAVGGRAIPRLLNVAGRRLLALGSAYGGIEIYRLSESDSGDAWSPVAAGLAALDPTWYAAPAWGDVDGDGAPELVVGGESGGLMAYRPEKARRQGSTETGPLSRRKAGL